MIIRTDDTPWGLTLEDLKKFCNICDRWGFKILHAVTIWGDCTHIDSSWSNKKIVRETHKQTVPQEFIDYLLTRKDLIGTHGYHHTHCPSLLEQKLSKEQLEKWGFKPTYAVLPFNEESEEYSGDVLGMKVSGKTQRLEDYLKDGVPTDEIVYLHIWRWPKGWYSWESLDETLRRIANARR